MVISEATQARATDAQPRSDARFAAVVVVVYAAWIAFMALHHELFRDEVRAATIAAHSHSLRELFINIRNEGHPALWYLILYGLVHATGTVLVLKPLSVLTAVAGVWIFLWRAPLARWHKVLFAFGVLPAFEYAVMCRNYGIGMLLLFAVASCWRERFTHPLRLAVLLALLANTNVHSLILVGILVMMLAGEFVMERPVETRRVLRAWFPLPAAMVGLGIAASAYVLHPDSTSVVTQSAPSHTAGQSVVAILHALIAPTGCFARIVGRWPELGMRIGFFALLFHLFRKPWLSVAVYLTGVAFTLFDQFVYENGYRHIGILFMFVLVAVWIDRETSGGLTPLRAQAWMRRWGEPAIGVMLVSQVFSGLPDAIGDLRGPRSMAQALGDYLQSHEPIAHATVIGEPDALIETLRYYASNPIYLPREGHFLEVKVNFTTANRRDLTLDELMAAGDSLPGPVVIALSHKLSADGPYVIDFPYSKQFHYSRESLAKFESKAQLLTRLDGSDGKENYTVYRWR